MQIGKGQQITLILVLLHDVDQVGGRPVGMKNFPFPVDDVFLQIEGRGFRNTEIFQGIGYGDPEFLGNPEKMVNSRATVKQDGRIILQVDPGLPEFPGRNPFHLDERPEIYLYGGAFSQFGVGGLDGCRFGLCYENRLDLQFLTF